MTSFYWLREDEASHHSGDVNAAPRWGLPGVSCPSCGATWAEAGTAYPCVDLSQLPERAELESPRPESLGTFERLRELVRPLVPQGVPLPPGTELGLSVGTASGSFGPFYFQNPWTLFIRREVLEQLQDAGVRGLKACRPELRFRQKNPPELMELQIEPHGMLHPDCLPLDRKPPCQRCGRDDFSRPEEPILDKASLPKHLDLFRLAHFPTMLIGTERFAEAVQLLNLDGIVFRKLPVEK